MLPYRLIPPLVILRYVSLCAAAYIEVRTPYPGEIYNQEDMYLDFSLRDMDLASEGGQMIVGINGHEVLRTTQNDNYVKGGVLPRGLHFLTIQLIDRDGQPTSVSDDREFEITTFQPPELIMPLPEGAQGIRSEDIPLMDDEIDPSAFSATIQRTLFEHQNPSKDRCTKTPFLIWEPWGIVGFGAQLLGLRVALSLGLQASRIVVGNADWEDNLVNSELKWRFNLTSSEQGSPWGERGALQPLSWCAPHSSVADSVRLLPGVDMFDSSITNIRVAGDLWGVENRERIFDLPNVTGMVPAPGFEPNIFWWWTEATHYLHRPTPALGDFIEAQKVRMGWKHPIIGIHMRLGVDKNREAQRFPTKYYIHEARRLRALFGANTIFVCSDRRLAVDKMVSEFGTEFEILVQPRVEGALPMYYVHTDLTLLGEADYLVLTISSNFGMAALLLNAWVHGHRPTYISMDDLFEGFRYYGHQVTLSHNPATGFNELGVRSCALQLTAHGHTLLLTVDKRDDASELCAHLLGEERCLSPRQIRFAAAGGAGGGVRGGEVVWDSDACAREEDYDVCQARLISEYRRLLRAATAVREKGECEEECDDKGCSSLADGNRRVLGFGVRMPVVHEDL